VISYVSVSLIMWMGGASCDSIAIARHGAFLPLYRLAVILAHSADANRFDRAIAVTAQLAGLCSMDWPDYLRDQAAKYRQLAEQTDDAVINDELLEWASVCEEVASNIEDHVTGR
jgi:hypothetical protein